jgi:hypothetical protein
MNVKFILVLFFISSFASITIAQPAPPPPPTDEPGCWPPPCIPIDGGISLLVAAGVIYGGKKLYFNRKERNTL